jgi:ArsR family transcriptional regulator
MTNHYLTQSKLYKILSHPTRLAILDILRDGEQCVCHMEAMSGLRQAHISQHLMVLREAGLVTDRRDGWNIFYRVIRPEIYAALDAMNAIHGTKSIDYTQIAASKPRRKACPCPKCNPEREDYSCEPEEAEPAGM